MAYDVTTVKLVYHFTESKHVFQPKCKFSFARLLRSLRSYWEDVKCKSNIFWVLDFKSFLTPYWFKKLAFRISLPLPALLDLPLPALLSPASRTPPAPYSPGLPPPCLLPPPPNSLEYKHARGASAKSSARHRLAMSLNRTVRIFEIPVISVSWWIPGDCWMITRLTQTKIIIW